MMENEWVKTKYGYARPHDGAGGFEDAPDGKHAMWFIITTVDEFGDSSEELDIFAVSKKAARALARDILEADYIPGLVIKECILA
jgi:hypothetical protein